MHNYCCRGDLDDLDDGYVLASDTLDSSEAELFFCKIHYPLSGILELCNDFGIICLEWQMYK